MALKSSNVANTLLQALDKIISQGESLVITKETATLVGTLKGVCTVLVDSAETLAENTGDPTARNKTFDFANKIKAESKVLEDLKQQIETDPTNASLKPKLLSVTQAIATICNTISIGEDSPLLRVAGAAKHCANDCKLLVSSVDAAYEVFFEACKLFGQASLELTKQLGEVARAISDNNHKKQVVNAASMIKELSSQLIRAAKKAYEKRDDHEVRHELQQIALQLNGKIATAISLAQPDGGKAQNEIGASQPVIPIQIPEEAPAEGGRPRRRSTITESGPAKDILTRVRTASEIAAIHQTLDELKSSVPDGSDRRRSLSTSEDMDTDQLIASIEKDLDIIESDLNNFQDYDPTKGTDEELRTRVKKLAEENKMLLAENESLLRVIDSMRKRGINKFGQI